MEMELCWFTMSGWEPRPKTYRAPSWSWASLDCPCRYDLGYMEVFRHSTLYAHVLNAHVVPSGPNIFGPVCAGVLKLGCTAMLHGELRKTRQYHKKHGYCWTTKVTVPFSSGHVALGVVLLDCMEDENGTVVVLPITAMTKELPRSEMKRSSTAIQENSRYHSSISALAK